MPKEYYNFVCSVCEKKFTKWQGHCPSCDNWNTLKELDTNKNYKNSNKSIDLYSLEEISNDKIARISTISQEFDRILGGGLVAGSAVLIGGEPGIGKSTLLLKSIYEISKKNKAIYVSGEESLEQIKIRAKRLELENDSLKLATTNSLQDLISLIVKEKPRVLVVDSIQAIFDKSLETAMSSTSQLRNTVSSLVDIAKQNSISIFLVGHITKEGQIAGPKLIEHMVDVVIYFENDLANTYRVLRTTKNRFGTTNEIGIFEMTNLGLIDVKDPSLIFLPDVLENNVGATIGSTLTGNRNILVETQTLISHSYTAMPRRTVVGYETNRLAMLLAVIEKYLDYNFSTYDIFINIAGGLKVKDTSLDLSIVASIISNYQLKPISYKTLFIGEISLTGKIKIVPKIEYRLSEAKRLGFNRFIVPKNWNKNKSRVNNKEEVLEIEDIKNLPDIIFGS